jgi:Tfp pilus assembly protein PilN
MGARFAAAQPKALVLAAAVNSATGVIVDTEANTLMVIVLREGLPEVVREVGIDPGMTREQWVNAVTTHVSRTVAYYDSLYPDEPVEMDAPLFLTGSGKTVAGTAQVGIERLPFPETGMPPVMKAPKDFPFERFAANVGMALLAGRRTWLRPPVPVLARPRLDFLPEAYRPKPFPVRAVATGAVVAGLSAGLIFGYQYLGKEAAGTARLKKELATVERMVQNRTQAVANSRATRAELDALKQETLAVQTATSFIRNLDRDFYETASSIESLLPPGVIVAEINDDGNRTSVKAVSDSYDLLLAYARLLEGDPRFREVYVRSISVQGAQTEQGARSGTEDPSAQQAPSYAINLDIIRGDLPASIFAAKDGNSTGSGSAASSQRGAARATATPVSHGR